MVATDIVERGE